MSNPAVSDPVQQACRQAQPMPGHVFSLYLPFWREGIWRKDGDEAKRIALSRVRDTSRQSRVKQLADHLNGRQTQLAKASGALTIEATSASPFVTGMGEEHAVENGFAFLAPYGLPYLAGSGVKGVIRRAAEELAAGLNPDGNGGWTFTRVMWLFGFEGNAGWMQKDPEKGRAELLAPAWEEELASLKDTDEEAAKLADLLGRRDNEFIGDFFRRIRSGDAHLAGALAFWDVIIAGDLDLDILTPHYGEYYQGSEPPHDAGQPQPNPFLVVGPKAKFTFHVTCAEHRLPESLTREVMDKDGNTKVWCKLLKAAFDHAFAWGGFGAKTAVGYGVLQRLEDTTNASATATPQGETAPEMPGRPAPSDAASAAESTRSTFHKGQRVIDTDSGETGTIMDIHDDVATVDFDGVEDEVPLEQLKGV